MAVPKANQRAVNKYVKANYDRINVTMPKGEKEVIQECAAAHGESVNSFIVRSIRERMERDGADRPQEAVGGPQGAGVVSLPSDTLRTVQEAAQASGETPSQFISRATDTQFQEDTRVRLNEDRQDQTTADLVFEIEDTARLVTSTLWCNVSYNDKLYKKPKDAQKVHDALMECKQRVCAMLDSLIEKIGAHGNAHK